MSFQAANPYQDAGTLRLLMQTHAHPEGDATSSAAVVGKYADRGYGALSVAAFGRLDWPWPVHPEGMIPVEGTEFGVGGIRHFTSLFADFLPPSAPDPQACIDGIRAKGGLAIVCHPDFYWFYTPADGWNVDKLAALNGLTGIEIYNRRAADLAPGQEYALDTWDALLSRGRRVWGFAVDDYGGDEPDFDQGKIVVLPVCRSASAVKHAISNGRFYSVVGASGLSFDKIETIAGGIDVMLNQSAEIRFIGRQGKVIASTRGQHAHYKIKGDEGYVRIEARSSTTAAYSNPIFVERATDISDAWYLAEGSSAWGFNTYLSLENPGTAPVSAELTYMTRSGQVPGGTVTLPGSSQATVDPRATVGQSDFSTRIVCRDGAKVYADRTTSWTGPGAASAEAHSSVGVREPCDNWYLPEGSSAWGFECWLLIQNPGTVEATCDVTYMVEGEGPRTFLKKVPAGARASFNMKDDIGAEDASIEVGSDQRVVCERAMYRNNRREGHDSIGTTTPAADYFLAEGTTAHGFTTYVLVQNPNDIATDVTLTYMTPQGPRTQVPFRMAADSRKTVRVNDVAGMGETDFSTVVRAESPIIAERAMYWNSPAGEACHDSIGMPEAHTTFYLPDGETWEGTETWTLVQNPNPEPVEVEVSYLTRTGTGNVIFSETVAGNSRRSFSMGDRLPGTRASVRVRSMTPGAPIVVERAMYWDNRAAGTDTIGGYSD